MHINIAYIYLYICIFFKIHIVYMFDITNPWLFTSLGLPHRYRLDGDNLRFGLNRWNWLVVGNAQRFLWKRRPEHRFELFTSHIYLHWAFPQCSKTSKDIQVFWRSLISTKSGLFSCLFLAMGRLDMIWGCSTISGIIMGRERATTQSILSTEY